MSRNRSFHPTWGSSIPAMLLSQRLLELMWMLRQCGRMWRGKNQVPTRETCPTTQDSSAFHYETILGGMASSTVQPLWSGIWHLNLFEWLTECNSARPRLRNRSCLVLAHKLCVSFPFCLGNNIEKKRILCAHICAWLKISAAWQCGSELGHCDLQL